MNTIRLLVFCLATTLTTHAAIRTETVEYKQGDTVLEGYVDWQLVSYGGAVHSFTDWNAGSDNSKGAAYNEKADQRSWEAMRGFFAEALK